MSEISDTNRNNLDGDRLLLVSEMFLKIFDLLPEGFHHGLTAIKRFDGFFECGMTTVQAGKVGPRESDETVMI